MTAHDNLLTLALAAAREAGALLKEQKAYATTVVTMSTDRDIKLAADVQAERIIRGILAASGLPILGEEEGWDVLGDRSGTHWIVDGLDGTVNFHYGLPLACVSIALVVDGAPAIGVVYDFNNNDLFVGQVGIGTTLNGSAVGVSKIPSRSSALLLSALATKGDFSDAALERFGRSLGAWKKVRMLGSAALSMAYVAAGRADACELSGIMEWDVAAGIALVRAAGGTVTEIGSTEPHVTNVFAHNGLMGEAG